MLRAVITLTLLFSLVGSGQKDNHAPQLTLRDIQGAALRLSDYKGKVVLLNFWATWCSPCRAEMPDLVEWQRKYRRRGLQIIGVTYPPTELAEARRFTKSIKVNYPIALGDKRTKDQFDQGETLPITVVIDRKGVVREIIQGVLFPEEFELKVKPLL